jgi:hypothetical protein
VSPRLAALLPLLILAPAAMAATFQGRVIENQRGTPVPHAFVTINGTIHVEADSTGFFRVDDLPDGSVKLQVDHVAYMPLERTVQLRKDHPTEMVIRLRLRVQTIDPVEVGATRPDPSVPQGKRTITAMQIRKAAGGVATDPLRVVQALPGSAAAGDDFSNRYVVRGGDPEENIVLYDDAYLLQPVHLEGFTSVIYDDLVGSVDLYPGALPPRLGDALSSVTMLGAARPEKNRRFFRYDLGSIALGGQFNRDANTAVAAARTSFYNLIVRRPPGVKTRSFQDFAGKATHEGSRFETSLTAVASRDRETGDVDRSIDSYLACIRIGSLPGLNKWRLGASMTDRKADAAVKRPRSMTKGEQQRLELSGLVLRSIAPDLQARFDGGVRGENFDDSIHKYSDPGAFLSAEGTYTAAVAAVSAGARVEKIPFTKSVPVSPYVSFRIRGLGAITPGGAYRIVRQSPFALNESYEVAGLPVDAGHLLSLVEGDLEPLRADHLSASLDAELGHGLSAGVEVYKKSYDNLLTWELYPEGHKLYGQMNDSTIASDGSGKGTGCELSLRREKGRVTGVASYSFSKTEKQEGPAAEMTNADYDRPRMLQIALDIPVRGGTSFALAYRASTGRPITPLIAIGNGKVTPGEINSDRLPSYRRLDVKLEHRVVKQKTEAFLYLDVLNILNHRNVVDLIQFNGVGGEIVRIEREGVRILPVAGFGFYF